MRRLVIATLILALMSVSGPTVAAEEEPLATGSFGSVGTLADGRVSHAATLLPGGRVLVIGGSGGANGGLLDSIEVWDPAAGEFTTTAGTLTQARAGHTATPLADGRVLVTGGAGGPAIGDELASAKIWDPATGQSAPTGFMTSSRAFHTATALPDGRVLVVGGDLSMLLASDALQPSAEVWDPTTGEFSPTASPGEPRSFHTATLLLDGRVLIVGGITGGDSASTTPSAEIWDPTTGEFTEAASLGQHRGFHTATLLPDGRVLIVGGFCGYYCPLQTEAWLWDPEADEFNSAGWLVEARATHTATLMPDGRVLIVGGKDWWDRNGSFGFADVWDPTTMEFSPGEGLAEPRGFHTATLLPDGRVIIIGGDGATGMRALAEVWVPATTSSDA